MSADGVGFRCGVEDAAVFNQKHATVPFCRWSGGFSVVVILRRRRLRDAVSSVAPEISRIEKSHAHGDAVGDLFENAGLRAVGDFGRDFDAAIHRAGMQDERIGLGGRRRSALSW